MSPWAHITREVDQGRAGPDIGAFFDLDRTLVAGFSAATFLLDGIRRGLVRTADVVATLASALRFQLGQRPSPDLSVELAGLLRGLPERELEAAGERLFEDALAADVFPEARALVRAHRRRGHTLAIVSSATRYQVEPIARDLGIPTVLCTRLEVHDGRFTGRLLGAPCHGTGKLDAAQGLCAAHGIDLARSWFYSDSEEDLPLLEAVGHARPTNPTRALAGAAQRHGWPVRRFTTRGLPAPRDLVRTSLAVASLVPSVLLGLPVAALQRRWLSAINLATSTWGEIGTALAGLDVRVEGADHLWSHRPAVFVFNHQSPIDVLVLCKLLQRDVAGVGGTALRRMPLVRSAAALAGLVVLDGIDPRTPLAPAVDALRRGLSIAIAPEGGPGATPRLRRFRRSAFRLAMAAGVPVVPIVLRNTHDALPRQAFVLRPARVDVVVHPPIATTAWTATDLRTHVAAVERLYTETLEG